MPVRVFITEGTRADCKEAVRLIEDIPAEYLLTDRGYDTDEIIEFAEKNGMIVVIPTKKNRKEQRPYDKDLYKLRHLVENAFFKLKQWRGIATRYEKTRHLFWVQSRFVVSRSGCKSSLNSCRHYLISFTAFEKEEIKP